MPVIFCQNTRVENGERQVTCDRFLIDIPTCLVECLQKNPLEKIKFRCGTCPPYDRWAVMYSDKEGKLVWESSGDKPDFGNKLSFDTIIATEQVA